MRNFIFVFTLFLLQIPQLSAQEISAVILDHQTKQPIPYATVQYAPGKGVITNEEGHFSINSQTENDSLVISSLG